MLPEVVVLDDSDDLRFLIKSVLKSKAGLTCLSVGSFAEFIEKKDLVLATWLAILDINLGEDNKNGLDAGEWLRSNGYTGRICFFTGHAGNHPMVTKARNSGYDILEKPLVGSQLIDLVNNVNPHWASNG